MLSLRGYSSMKPDLMAKLRVTNFIPFLSTTSILPSRIHLQTVTFDTPSRAANSNGRNPKR